MSRLTHLLVLVLLQASPVAAQAPGEASDPVFSLRQLARSGDVEAQYKLADALLVAPSITNETLSESVHWLSTASTSGHTMAQRRLALLHLNGRGVPQSFKEAQKLFFQAAQKNDDVSQYHLARLLLSGKAGTMSVETSVTWFERSAEAGHKGAQLELGRLYLEGKHVTQDVESGLNWITAAAEQEYAPSMLLLARLYEGGDLIPQNLEQARYYFQQSADAGLPAAQVWVAKWYETQSPPQYTTALRYYRKAAEQDDPSGHFGIARLNLERLLRTPNSRQGLEHLQIAVALNLPEAHYTIGRLYGNGKLSGGSPLALEHFQQGASLGHTDSMYELGLAYYQGTQPLKRNPSYAARWWRRAASSGHLESLFAFAVQHLQGVGVERNVGIAFALVNIAAARGHSEAIVLRDELMTSLPPDLLREAQDLSVSMYQSYVPSTDESSRERLK